MTETTPDLPTSSEYAEELARAGMKPLTFTQDDLDKMLAQMNALQAQVNLMNAERGVPLDRVAGYLQQLKAHFQHRKSSRQDTDFAAPEAALAALPENSDNLTAHHTESLHFTIEQWLKQHPGKELDYLHTLAAELHQAVLEREGKHGVMHQRVAELEKTAEGLAKTVEGLSADQRVTTLEKAVADLVAMVEAWKSAQSTPKSETPNG